MSFINPNLSHHKPESFTIYVEVRNNTAIFCGAETEITRFIGPKEFRGYGHEFEKAFTTSQISGSTGHHRIISYNFGGLKFVVRYETDGYIEGHSEVQPQSVDSENEDLLGLMQSLTLSQPKNHSPLPTESKLTIKGDGKQVPIQSTLEIKTRVSHKPISIQEVLPQLWASQTPNLVRAYYHKDGLFAPPEVEDVTREITKWEEDHADDLRRLVLLIKEIIRVVTENGRNAVIKHDGRSKSLEVWRRDGSSMLPDDLYLKFDNKTESAQAIESDPRITKLKIGHTLYAGT
jgi:hypothetical protein